LVDSVFLAGKSFFFSFTVSVFLLALSVKSYPVLVEIASLLNGRAGSQDAVSQRPIRAAIYWKRG
jgi:hypothetical protein